MSPDRRSTSKRVRPHPPASRVRLSPTSDDPHEIVYFRRHEKDDPGQSIPGRDFLEGCPLKVRVTMRSVLVAVATSPPKRFAGGGYWEAMKKEMTGWFEVRGNGPKRHHYRLFCRLDYEAAEQEKPLLVVIAGLEKPYQTELSAADYAAVRALQRSSVTRPWQAQRSSPPWSHVLLATSRSSPARSE